VSAPDHAPKRGPGRPPVDDDQRRDKFIKIRASEAEKAKFEALGATAWFRPILQRAKVKQAGNCGG
jgi:hypothetical protein